MSTPMAHHPEEFEESITVHFSYDGPQAHIAFMQAAKMIEAFASQSAQMMLEAKAQEQQAHQLANQLNQLNFVPQLSHRRVTNGTR